LKNEELLEKIDKIVKHYGLRAEILAGIYSVGVGGDERSYTPVINLIGPFPGHDILEKISNEITNTFKINRITFQIGERG
jgi:hypothetical protein